MRALFVVLALFSLTASAYEIDLASWKLLSKKTEKATTPTKVAALVKKYPKLFRGENVKKITKAHVTTTRYEYIGAHSCPPGDARLFRTNQAMGYCKKIPQGEACGESQVSAPTSTFDPCLFP